MTTLPAPAPPSGERQSELIHGTFDDSGSCSRRWQLDLVVLTVIVLLATVPFLNKAFHIDDFYYLQVARQILKDPWRPFDFQLVAQGRIVYVFDNNLSPPLFSYVLALGLLAFGENEIPLHGIMSLFTACVAGATYALSLRFTPRPLLATALVILNPIFIPGQNLMLDVPMLALGLAGIACHVWGTDRASVWFVLTGGLLAGLAVVTKYPALIVFPLIALYSLVKRSWLGLAALGMALLPLAVWCTENLLVHGRVHFIAPVFGGHHNSRSDYALCFLSVLNILGSGFVPLLIVSQTSFSRRLSWGILLTCFLLSAARQTHWRDWFSIQVMEHFVFFASGLYLLLASFVSVARRSMGNDAGSASDRVFLVMWLALGWFMSLGSHFIAVRHVLWALPAAALLVTRVLMSPQTKPFWSYVLIVLVGGAGLSVGWADMEYANIQRGQVETIRESWARKPWPMYYLGEDSFSYYCATAGWKPFLTEKPLEPEAGLLCAASTSWALSANLRRRLKRVEQMSNSGWFPVTTMSHGVNFYRTGVSDLPWAVGATSELYLDYYFLAMPEGQQH